MSLIVPLEKNICNYGTFMGRSIIKTRNKVGGMRIKSPKIKQVKWNSGRVHKH
jgi:hypothetical protein